MADSLGRIQPLRTYTHTVHDAVAAEYAESIVQIVEARLCLGIAAVDQETVSGQKARRADKLVRIPPERRTGRRTAGAENTLV